MEGFYKGKSINAIKIQTDEPQQDGGKDLAKTLIQFRIVFHEAWSAYATLLNREARREAVPSMAPSEVRDEQQRCSRWVDGDLPFRHFEHGREVGGSQLGRRTGNSCNDCTLYNHISLLMGNQRLEHE